MKSERMNTSEFSPSKHHTPTADFADQLRGYISDHMVERIERLVKGPL